jgi:hypothetical protein
LVHTDASLLHLLLGRLLSYGHHGSS